MSSQRQSRAARKAKSVALAHSVNDPAAPQQPASLPAVTPIQTIPALADDHSPPWSVTTKAIVTIAALVLAVAIMWRFQDLIRPIVIAAIIAYLLNPLIVWLMRRSSLSRGVAVVVVYLTGLILVIVGVGVLGIVAYDQLVGLARSLPNSISEVVNLAEQVQVRLEMLLAQWSTQFSYDLRGLQQDIDLRALVEQAISLVRATLSRSGWLAATIAQTTINTISTGLLIFFISLYIAKDSPQLQKGIGDLAHQPGYRHDAERLVREFLRIWDAYLRGQVILGLVIGVVVSLSLSALGVNNALGLGILSGVLEFLPVLGPLIGTAAAVLVALFQPDNYLGIPPLYFGLTVLAIMILIQQLENNLLVPRIVGEALDLHPLVVMISVVMGASLAGMLGAVLAAPVAASMKLFGAYAWRKLLDLPPFPEPEPAPKPRRGQQGWPARFRLWRLQFSQFVRRRA